MSAITSQRWLFSLWREDGVHDPELLGHLVAEGRNVEQAWANCDPSLMGGWTGRNPWSDAVHAISCEEELAGLSTEELSVVSRTYRRAPLGERWLGRRGGALKAWKDRGPLQLHAVISVVEYRTPVPGAATPEEDRVVSVQMSYAHMLTQGQRLLFRSHATTTLPGGQVIELQTGEGMPAVIGPGDPSYDGLPRYLVRWLFTAPADFILADGLRLGVPQEEVSEDLPILPGVRLVQCLDARSQLLRVLKQAGQLDVVHDVERIAYLFCVPVVDEDGEAWKTLYALGRGESVDEAWRRSGQATIEAAHDGLQGRAPGTRLYLEEVRAISCEESLAEAGLTELRQTWGDELALMDPEIFLDENWRRVRAWRDRGPIRKRLALTVLEYRALAPGSPGLSGDPVRWSHVQRRTALARDDQLRGVDVSPAGAVEYSGVPVAEGQQLAPWYAPDSEDYPGEPRYLVHWVFNVPPELDVEALRLAQGLRLTRLLASPASRQGVVADVAVHHRRSAREALLQHLLEWTADRVLTRPGAPGEETPGPAVPVLRTPSLEFELVLPYDPRPQFELLVDPRHGLGEILEVQPRLIQSEDVLAHAELAGFLDAEGWVARCDTGTHRTRLHTTVAGYSRVVAERMARAHAAACLHRLGALVATARPEPLPADEARGELIADLRTADGSGRIYREVSGTTVLTEHGIGEPAGWRLPGLAPTTVLHLTRASSLNCLPRLHTGR